MKNNDTIDLIKGKLGELIENKNDSDYTLTASKQAKEMGIPYNTFMKYVRGISEPSASYLKRIADYYDVSCDYLMDGTNYKGTQKDGRFVSDYTGLTSDALAELRAIVSMSHQYQRSKRMLTILNWLIEQPEFEALLHALEYCARFSQTLTDYEVDLVERNEYPDYQSGKRREIEEMREVYRTAAIYNPQRLIGAFAERLITESEKQKTALDAGDAESGHDGQN